MLVIHDIFAIVFIKYTFILKIVHIFHINMVYNVFIKPTKTQFKEGFLWQMKKSLLLMMIQISVSF